MPGTPIGGRKSARTIKRRYGEKALRNRASKGGHALWKKIKSGQLNNPL